MYSNKKSNNNVSQQSKKRELPKATLKPVLVNDAPNGRKSTMHNSTNPFDGRHRIQSRMDKLEDGDDMEPS